MAASRSNLLTSGIPCAGDPDKMVRSFSLYKRPSRELPSMDGIVATNADQEQANQPVPWHLSLPHICVALIISALFGYHIGVVNIPLPYISRDLGFGENSLAQGFVVSVCLIGAFAGCAISGTVADRLGRRRAFQLCAIPMVLGPILSAKAWNLASMLVGRLLVGCGLGIGAPVLALYVSEVSPTQVRGSFGSFPQTATCIGLLAALIVGLPISSTPDWWRACFWISTLPAALLLLGMEFCAESPRWLFKNSRWYEAEHELERLWGAAHAKAAMSDLVQSEQSDDLEMIAPWKELLDRRYVRAVLLGGGLFALQQFSGINAIFYFSSTVLKSAGVSSDLAATVSVGAVNLVGSFVAAGLMDRLGRRKLMMWSFTGMAVSMAMQAAVAAFGFLKPIRATTTLIGTLFYVFSFASGAGPVPALLLPEIIPIRIRGKAMAFAMCVHWVAHFLVGLLFLPLINATGASVLYTFFSLVCFFAAIFVKRNVVETKGRSLEDLEMLLVAGH
ncbi:probable plastidic glucose transporter 2 isoform X1 [Selaginella moellendorffii]|uniref:probable plastidic glucose transporter 2 isoform X1 n=2 Tax=Selaginella moellendorffii TaxID=88036 RepID=UPI000D1CE6B7|nr:probable plastidic glucose transporter 2 isoform X1 [Selaginella moellendorffii]|eukprot:XP_024540180.1 probable plastidic glucose transporter 2 isoform X1 [Selaginella moellendorffii]